MFRGKIISCKRYVKEEEERKKKLTAFYISNKIKGNDYRIESYSMWLSNSCLSLPLSRLLIHSFCKYVKKFLIKNILAPQFILVFQPYITWKILSLVNFIHDFFFLYKGNGIKKNSRIKNFGLPWTIQSIRNSNKSTIIFFFFVKCLWAL